MLSLPPFEEIEAEAAKAKLRVFVKASWRILEPATEFVENWHSDAICEHLEAVESGQIQNLVINVPPGHSKSLICNVFWPARMWARNPAWRLLFASYAANLVRRDARKFRMLITSEWYRRWMRTIRLTKDTEDLLTNSDTGFRQGMSVGGETTGQRGDGFVIDDPLNATDSQSEAAIENCLWWYDQGMANRLNDMQKSFRVLIMQRLSAKDLSGHVIKAGGWDHLCLPSEYEPARRCVTSIGWKDPRTTAGELLFPQRFPASVIAVEKRRLGSYGYSGQHQQSPAPSEGGLFKRAWFRYFTRELNHYVLHRPEAKGGDKRVLISDCWRFQTADLALTEEETSDYTVIDTWDVTPDNELLLIEVERFKAEAPDVKKRLISSRHGHQPTYQAIESAHYGIGVCQEWLRAGMPLRPLKAVGDKPTRSIQAQLMVENGRMYFAAGAVWLVDFESELMTFPKAEHDDQCVAAGTVVETERGPRPIEAVRSGDNVLTSVGMRSVLWAGQTSGSASVREVGFADGRTLLATGNHPLFVAGKGWIVVDSVRYGDIVVVCDTTSPAQTPIPSSFTGSTSIATQSPVAGICDAITSHTPATSETAFRHCILRYGRRLTGQCLLAAKSTTWMRIRSITPLRIWNACVRRLTASNTESRSGVQPNSNTSTRFGIWRPIGMGLWRVESGTPNKHPPCSSESCLSRMCASDAESGLPQRRLAGSDTARKPAPLPPGERRESTTRLDPVSDAELSLSATGTANRSFAGVAVVSVKAVAERRPVYNLHVEGQPEYFANGVLVHNCDCVSYAAMEIGNRAPGGIYAEDDTEEHLPARPINIGPENER